MKSGWKTYKGVRYLLYDISNLGSDDDKLARETTAARALIITEPLNSVLCLCDANGTDPSMKGIQALQSSAQETNPYIEKAAVIGVTGSKSILLQLVNRFVKRQFLPFEDFDSAAEWLVTDKIAQ